MAISIRHTSIQLLTCQLTRTQLMSLNSNPSPLINPAPWPTLRDRWLQLAMAALLAGGLLTALFAALHSQHASLTTIKKVDAQELASPDLAQLKANDWQRIELPGKLCIDDCRFSFKAYRYALPASSPPPQMIYLPGFDGAAAAYMNGHLIGQSGSLQNPVADTNYQPQAYRLPASVFNARGNELVVIVSSVLPRGGRLAPFVLGSSVDIQSAYLPARTLTVSVLPFLIGALAILGCCAVLLYFAGDRDRVYLWFALLTALCSARLMLVTSPEWPADPLWRHCQYLISTSGVLVASTGFFSRLLGRPASRFDLSLMLLWIAASIAVVIAMSQDMNRPWLIANQVIGYTGIAVGAFVLSRFVVVGHVLPPRQQCALLVLIILGLGLLLHDVWFVLNRQLLLFQLSNLATAPLIAAFCLALAHRYSSHVNAVMSANDNLRQAVNDTRAELSLSYERLRAADQERTLAEERSRLLQDMHDGVAGKLSVLAQRLRRNAPDDNNAGREIEESLIDLRLIIDSLDSSDSSDIRFAIGNLRSRSEPWLSANGVTSTWDLRAQNELPASQADCLNICRIIQEALTNVLKHSHASHVVISLSNDKSNIAISVSDDGEGINTTPKSGRGLSIMRQRAEALGGSLSIESSNGGRYGGGCTVRLVLPRAVGTVENATSDAQTP
ncbi:MAG: ATP-binding protein [Pseudomonadaceae bacterium]|nr:ATP-binding protein [Pseudomonadaceae bacterium]